MSQLIAFAFILLYFLHSMKHVIGANLPKPALIVISRDPDDVIMMGDTITFVCETAYEEAKSFTLEREKSKPTTVQTHSNFTVSGITFNDTGSYTCKYRDKSSWSEPSDHVYIYVRETFPEPEISVQPRKIVQPGMSMIITCTARYENVTIYFLKNNHLIKEEAISENSSSYEIKSVSQENIGQYICRYSKWTVNKLQILSEQSLPMSITIKDLPKPSVSKEINKDGSLGIHCTAPNKYEKMWFQLLNDTNHAEQEIEETREKEVTFVVKDPKHFNKPFYCIYSIRIGSDYADSLISNAAGFVDYTQANIIRLLLAVIIFIITCVIFWNYINSLKNFEDIPPELPSGRVRFIKEEKMETVIESKDNEYKE